MSAIRGRRAGTSPSAPARQAARCPRGFTLIEVVIALSLAALIMMGLLAALRGIGDSSDKVSHVSDRVSDMRLVSDFLRRALAGAQALPYVPAQGEAARGFYFQGDADAVRWLAPLPARHGTRGLHFMALRTVREGGTSALVLDHLPFPGTQTPPNWQEVRSHYLIGDVEGFEIQYQGGEPGAPWEEEWHDDRRMPARVKLALRAAGRYWPELICPLTPL